MNSELNIPELRTIIEGASTEESELLLIPFRKDCWIALLDAAELRTNDPLAAGAPSAAPATQEPTSNPEGAATAPSVTEDAAPCPSVIAVDDPLAESVKEIEAVYDMIGFTTDEERQNIESILSRRDAQWATVIAELKKEVDRLNLQWTSDEPGRPGHMLRRLADTVTRICGTEGSSRPPAMDLEEFVAELTRSRDEALTKFAKAKTWNKLTELEINNLRDVYGATEAECERLRKDGERLDWMEAHKADVLFNDSLKHYSVSEKYKAWFCCKTLRQAIDAAMQPPATAQDAHAGTE